MDGLLERSLEFVKPHLRNWKAKLGSLVVAVLFFYYVQYTRNTTRAVHIRVETPVLPENLVVNSRIPSFVKVEFSGPREMMDFNPSNFKVALINPGPTPGDNRYRVELQPSPPDGIEVRHVDNLPIVLDRRTQRTLPLVADYELAGSPGLRAGVVQISPETIRVVGPAQVLSTMDRVKLTHIEAVPSQGDFVARVRVDALPEFVALGTDQPYEAELRLRLIPQGQQPTGDGLIERSLSVTCENAPPGLKLDESPSVRVLVRSPGRLPEGRLKAVSFCPVEVDSVTRNIVPSARVTNVPVYIRDSLAQKDIEILDVSPQGVSLQFSLVQVRQPTQVQKGLEEHLIQ